MNIIIIAYNLTDYFYSFTIDFFTFKNPFCTFHGNKSSRANRSSYEGFFKFLGH